MLLVGRNLSPYARKVAIWCALQGRNVERVDLAATDPRDAEAIKAYHPGLRVPALVLDDGTTLIDSFAICDWLDDSAPDHRLVPATGLARRTCMQRIALAHATTEKIVGLVYETNRRPEQYHWPDWRDRLVVQITGGFEAMEAAAPDHFYGGDMPDGADIATVCAYQMAEVTNGWLLSDNWTGLKGLAEKAMTMPAFAQTYPG
ncbi:MAG: glutathione S-transferase family protein [Devosia sp.]